MCVMCVADLGPRQPNATGSHSTAEPLRAQIQSLESVRNRNRRRLVTRLQAMSHEPHEPHESHLSGGKMPEGARSTESVCL
jgi:hypothetical protein